ncbi:MAG: SurA N-terminal domain-containing protein [Pseudomonadota bacterium]
MLEAIRERAQGWIAKVILALITIPFAFWGIDSYFNAGGNEPPVATIGDEDIAQREFFRALQNQRDAMLAQGRAVNIEDKTFRTAILDELVQVRLIAQAARDNGLVVPGGQMDQVVRSASIFQENNTFSEARFQNWLREQGMGQKELMALIERESLAQQFQMGYLQGAVAATSAAERLSALLAQQRDVSEAVFTAASFENQVTVDDAAVAAEYQAKQSDYATPAQIRVEYLSLSSESLAEQTSVSDAALRQYYDANKSRFQEPEQRSASHILILTQGKDKAAAKAQAEQILAQVKAKPASFGDLARKHSEDPGSAVKGGSLGTFGRGAMVPPFEKAVFSMKVGEISDLVESEFGFHIIRVDGIVPGTLLAFETVKDDIRAELTAQEAERKFADMAERFSNLVYEQADSLAPAAKEFGLTVESSGWIDRTQATPSFLANPRLMDALFSPEALEKKQNTEAIEVAPGVLVSARVLEHKPAGVRPLAEVADNIRARLRLKAAQAKAVEAGQAALKALEAGQPVAGMGPVIRISRGDPKGVPAEALKAIFKAPKGKLPAAAGSETRDGYRVYRVVNVVEASPDENRVKMIQRDLMRINGQEEMKAYLAYLKAQGKVKIDQAILEKKAD